jgi:SWI/SNF-related matrix-associated actin-dependent regulator of chromatin subfamily A3
VGTSFCAAFGSINASPQVAPLSILSNWEKQLEDHGAPGALTSCVYYGNNRGLSASELQKYDIVITTYQTVAGEHHDDAAAAAGVSKKKKKTERNLFDVMWKVCIANFHHIAF